MNGPIRPNGGLHINDKKRANSIDQAIGGIQELLGAPLANTLSYTFRRMDIVEEEIATAISRHPNDKVLIDTDDLMVLMGIINGALPLNDNQIDAIKSVAFSHDKIHYRG